MLSRFAAGSVKSGALGRTSTATSSGSEGDASDVAGSADSGACVGADSCPHATATSVNMLISTIAAGKFNILDAILTVCSSILVQGAPFECSLG